MQASIPSGLEHVLVSQPLANKDSFEDLSPIYATIGAESWWFSYLYPFPLDGPIKFAIGNYSIKFICAELSWTSLSSLIDCLTPLSALHLLILGRLSLLWLSAHVLRRGRGHISR